MTLQTRFKSETHVADKVTHGGGSRLETSRHNERMHTTI